MKINLHLRSTVAQLVDARLGIQGLLAGGVTEHFVFEQDTLSAAKYWFNPGRQEPIPT